MSPKGLVHNLLMQFFTLDNSKIKVPKTYFFDIVITWNDHPRYVKHVLARGQLTKRARHCLCREHTTSSAEEADSSVGGA